ncbi:hypothetical protein AGR6A_pa20003 [Agrobacterium sp. NCPPB 925]|nr:hypothetical protein AGR6A_pa20003 [Agrobacterium sp. NCPPB 925]
MAPLMQKADNDEIPNFWRRDEDRFVQAHTAQPASSVEAARSGTSGMHQLELMFAALWRSQLLPLNPCRPTASRQHIDVGKLRHSVCHRRGKENRHGK